MGISKSVDSYESGPSLASRICKIERQVNLLFNNNNNQLIRKLFLQVDGLDSKVDRLCQLANNILDRSNRQQVPTPTPVPVPIAPIVINRIRTTNPLHVFRRRQRRRFHRRTVLPTLSSSPQLQPPTPVLTSSTRSSSRTNLTQPSVPPSSPARDHSRESLVSLYCLFQDNINSSRTHIV